MMYTLMLCTTMAFNQGPVVWQTDYDQAAKVALEQKKDLVIAFEDEPFFETMLNQSELASTIKKFVLLKVSPNYVHQGKKLLSQPALAEMMGQSGLAIISMHDAKLGTHREAISVHPRTGSRYHWVPGYGADQVKIILDLPPTATLSQRSMLYALHVHPEAPRSIRGTWQPAFVAHAQRHSHVQANANHQHHANLITAMNSLQAETGIGLSNASEVVAESWGMVVGGENVLEACFSCIDAWRQSSGHWGAVSGFHRYFGYDIARGGNGTWYATGIFAD
jgi:hypothetical protein